MSLLPHSASSAIALGLVILAVLGWVVALMHKQK